MYNKSEIMKKAWELYKNKINDQVRKLYWLDKEVALVEAKKQVSFSKCLKYSWELAISKAKADQRKQEIANNKNLKQELETLDQKIFLLNMKDRMNGSDIVEMRELNNQRAKLISA